ncbi:tigger transposable element-derived protein 6-like [Acyrthosiphon pisum]|uniref:HTH CENPB-type domain-containing protein n=1 Tax=Acyrthosiphon pisum TaxID=7029 RepID=A0A8R2H4G3_ACYPI|nr:tigger transposable element-derived protein 6-like [Acyrthosiphon pisum]|eukprot:XP_016659159.1 PREDICTED: tigger transposable element-derived protein 6-like [Acyrthosiphon pisum]
MSKRQDLSATHKCDLLKSYDMLPKISLRDAAARLNVSHYILNRILKNHSNIERAIMDNESDSRKRKRAGKEEVVDKALKEWFLQVRKKDARINGPLLRQKAEDLTKKMGKDDFVATEGWFQRWKKRENISFIKTHEEQGEADFSAAQSWFKTHWTDLLSQYSPSDIFNADETGLYFRALPEHTYALKLDKAKGAKTSKERLTICVVMCCYVLLCVVSA